MSPKVHRPVSAGNPKRPTVICAECLVVWPCAAARKRDRMRQARMDPELYAWVQDLERRVARCECHQLVEARS